MGLLIFWAIMGLIVALIASSKGRSGFGWFIYGFLIWPIALVHVLVASRTAQGVRKKAIKEGRRPCPNCAEMIMQEASVCPFCRREIAPILK